MATKKQKEDDLQIGNPDAAPFRTGPNVDIGLVEGAVTLDPQTAAGQAAAAARDANGAKTKDEDGVTIVTEKGEPEGQGLISVEPKGPRADGDVVVEVK